MHSPQHGLIRGLESADGIEFPSRAAKIAFVVDALQAVADESQREIDALLAHESAATEPLFSSQYKSRSRNARYFSGARIELVELLASLSTVAAIREAEVGSVAESESPRPVSAIEWGVQRVEAPAAWAAGITGGGVVFRNVDTGVRSTHEALRDSRPSDYYWFEPVNKTPEPVDPHGHGTHTMGSIVGVAPRSQWMACLGCPLGVCLEAAVVACGEWFVCPTDSQGNNRDCSKAPRVINNSWSGRASSTTYAPMVAAWHAAGIIPIFANGNAGPLCNTARSPGNFANVIAVGATTINDTLASFSSKGPNAFHTEITKPDISGPGREILSASNASDTEYRVMSGTSMATPHVVGVVALLLSQNQSRTYGDVYTLLTMTTVRDALKPNLLAEPIGWYTGVCGTTSDTDWPNNQYGHGLVNARRATHANV